MDSISVTIMEDVCVREFDPVRDLERVEELEKLCATGSLIADSMGDPLGRVRHFPLFTMLVAEVNEELVGVIRAGVKEMVCGKRKSVPILARAAYILGLRVSPLHRRKGIGLELGRKVLSWCKQQGCTYAYIATEKSNKASSGLFVNRLGFRPARTPSILVHPVFQHRELLPSHVSVTRLTPADAATIYMAFHGGTDFFPAADISAILSSPRCAGTFIATLKSESSTTSSTRKLIESGSYTSFAIVSIWKCHEIFRLHVSGTRWHVRALAAASRALDRALPWLRISSFPNVFQPFGFNFLFGILGIGDRGGDLVGCLCAYARNVAREMGCPVVATELGGDDPLIEYAPHWKKLSSMDDLWCVKDLRKCKEEASDDSADDWLQSPMGSPVFVDPRDV